MSGRTGWFFAGLVLLIILGMYWPRAAGVAVILIVMVLLIQLARKNLL